MATEENDNGTATLSGHPNEGKSIEDANVKPENDEGTSTGKIEFEGHTFNSIDELKDSYRNLEKAYGDQGRRFGELKKSRFDVEPTAPTPTVPKPTVDLKVVGDLLIEDPEKGATMLSNYVAETVSSRLSETTAAKSAKQVEDEREAEVWGMFFKANPWLDHRQAEVKAVTYDVLWDDVGKLPQDDQFKHISDHFKAATEKSNDLLTGRDGSTRKNVGVAPGSPSGVSNEPEGKEKKRKTFADSIREKSHVPQD